MAFVARYVALHRAGDVEGLLAIHTPDTEFLMPGQEPIRGRDALRDLLEWDAVLESQLEMQGIRLEGNTLWVERVVERNRFFQALGLDQVRYGPGTRFVLREGLIAGLYPAQQSEEDLARGRAAYQRLMDWLAADRPDALQRLLPGGKMRYDAESARLWLDVLREWKTACG